MTELATMARPYAEAVFKVAKDADNKAEWSDMLAFIAVVVQDPEIASAAQNPKIKRKDLCTLILDICSEITDDKCVNFIKLLLENNRLSLVPEIAVQYEQYKADDEGYVDVEVISAYALDKAEQKKLSDSLAKELNKQVHINVSIDKSLIGGIFVRAGDRVIDGSIKGRLQQLAKQL